MEINNRPVEFLIDTGCDKTIVHISAININDNRYGKLEPCPFKVITANGSRTKIIGQKRYKISIGNWNCITDLIISTNTVRKCILGIDILELCPYTQAAIQTLRENVKVNTPIHHKHQQNMNQSSTQTNQHPNNNQQLNQAKERLDQFQKQAKQNQSVPTEIQTLNETNSTEYLDEPYQSLQLQQQKEAITPSIITNKQLDIQINNLDELSKSICSTIQLNHVKQTTNTNQKQNRKTSLYGDKNQPTTNMIHKSTIKRSKSSPYFDSTRSKGLNPNNSQSQTPPQVVKSNDNDLPDENLLQHQYLNTQDNDELQENTVLWTSNSNSCTINNQEDQKHTDQNISENDNFSKSVQLNDNVSQNLNDNIEDNSTCCLDQARAIISH